MRGLGPPRRRQRVRASSMGKDDHPTVRTRRIYDPRRWHKRSAHRNGSSTGGQPPAGWVLVWAGRFKRWRRRWFVAHPAGLLLYYKNSDQIGRPGYINLLGARIVPDAGKDRQIKIVRGPIVYYLRTTNKDFRQGWLDAINESVRIYNKSLQSAAVGALPGGCCFSRESYTHQREECQQQEKQLNERLIQRLHDIEPVREAFLQKLRALQQSLSVISETLGFSNEMAFSSNSAFSKPSVSNVLAAVMAEENLNNGVETPITPKAKDHGTHRSIFGRKTLKQRKSISLENQSSTNQRGIPIEATSIACKRSFSCPLDDSLSMIHDGQGTCYGRWWKKDGIRMRGIEDNHLTEFQSETPTGLPLSKKRMSSDSVLASKAIHKHDVDGTDCETSASIKENLGGTVSPGISCQNNSSGPNSGKQAQSSLEKPAIQNSLHAAWNDLQEAYAEALKEEIQRVIELEAENSVLQESLAILPQLQKDRLALLDLRARLTRDGIYTEDNTIEAKRGEDGEDSEDEISIVPTELTNEEYFEALEVLNQHEFIARSTAEEQENLAEGADVSQEPPEEGDCLDVLSEAELEDSDQPRTRLPAPRPLSMGFSLWTVLKNAIGKDLNHITMPATINEPLSALQRCAEQMQFRNLLDLAAQQASSMERLLLVSSFACASYYSSIVRDAKPFNPMLGETYEWEAPDGRARFLSEQVSHHPPIMAFQGEATIGDYRFYGEIEIKNKFWGKSVEVLPTGLCHVRIPKFEDHFTWNQVTTCIHNIVMGKPWIDNYGEMSIKNQKTGEYCRVRFHKASSREQGRISGKAYDSQGNIVFSLHGNYMDKILASPEPCPDTAAARCLWESPVPPQDYHQQYCFSQFAIGLNEMTPKLARLLPPTDSRFRPDQRALEDGDLEKATPEKFRLEEKQRVARKHRKEEGVEWKCMWFRQTTPGRVQVQTSQDVEPNWAYDGKYWGDFRERQAWDGCPDIM